uniref:Uncharacterized protein n=1 Tax=Kalanchoe fedtschenkoi TaxID=63787 RepID=A0A7N0SYX0_KALFE
MWDNITMLNRVLRNLELYLENKSILEANEKLRQKAFLLQRHNTALTAEINQKTSRFLLLVAQSAQDNTAFFL